MSAFARIVAGLISYFVVRLVFYFAHKEKCKDVTWRDISKKFDAEHWVVKGPKSISLFFCFIGLVFLFFVFLPPEITTGGDDTWARIGLLIFSLFNFFMDACVSLWKIELFRDEDWFIYRLLVKKHKIYYDECKILKYHNGSIFLKTKTKKISIPSLLINWEILIWMLHNHNVPEIREELQDRIVVRMKKVAAGLFIFLTAVFVILSVVCYFYIKADNYVVVLCVISACYFMGSTIDFLVFRVEILKGKDWFTYRAPFVKETKIYYKDCQEYIHGKVLLVLKTNDKKFFVNLSAENCDLLIKDLDKHGIRGVYR